jgi:hypothetical protein
MQRFGHEWRVYRGEREVHCIAGQTSIRADQSRAWRATVCAIPFAMQGNAGQCGKAQVVCAKLSAQAARHTIMAFCHVEFCLHAMHHTQFGTHAVHHWE